MAFPLLAHHPCTLASPRLPRTHPQCFPGDEGLETFRDWLHSVESGDDAAAASASEGGGSGGGESGGGGGSGGSGGGGSGARGARGKTKPAAARAAARKPSVAALRAMSRADRFKATHRSQRRAWQVSEGFPNRAVLAAYRNPTVAPAEGMAARLAWRAPNLDGLRLAARERFGWPDAKTDEQLLPVLRELTARGQPGGRQQTLES